MALAELCGSLMDETEGVVLGNDIAGDEGSFAITEHLASLRCAAVRCGERSGGDVSRGRVAGE